jgi:hypothetical protein
MGFLGEGLRGNHREVACIAMFRQLSFCKLSLYSASRFAVMPAVCKSAVIDDGGHFWKTPRDVIRGEVPKFDLPEARRIRHPAAALEWEETGPDSCVPAGVSDITGDANLQRESRLQAVKQG